MKTPTEHEIVLILKGMLDDIIKLNKHPHVNIDLENHSVQYIWKVQGYSLIRKSPKIDKVLVWAFL